MIPKPSSNLESLHSEHYRFQRKPLTPDTTFHNIKDLYIDEVHVTSKEDRVRFLSEDERKKVSVNKNKSNVTLGLETNKIAVTGKPPKSKALMHRGSISQNHFSNVIDESHSVPEILPSIDKRVVSECSSGKYVKETKQCSSSSKEVRSCAQSSCSPKEIGSLNYSLPGKSTHDPLKTLSDKPLPVRSLVCSLIENSDQMSARMEKTESKKRGDLHKDAIFDSDSDDDDNRESASDPTRHSAHLKKPSVSVPKRKVIQLDMPTSGRCGVLKRMENGFRKFRPPKLDDWYRPILEIDYFSIAGLPSGSADGSAPLYEMKEIPLNFSSPDDYIKIFRPLVLEEFKAQFHNSFVEASSSEEMFCGSLCVLSVERVDDFHIVRARPEDGESARAFLENDLVLLTKEPLQNTAQQIHAVGKVRVPGNLLIFVSTSRSIILN